MPVDTDHLTDALPASIQQLLDDQHDGAPSLTDTQLDVLTRTLLDTRTAHKNYRSQSGIEEVWLKAEEAYIGIDDANRHEFTHMRWQVPTNMGGPLIDEGASRRRTKETRSTAYVRLTARYVDAGAAKLQEILLGPDDQSFTFEATPDPDLVDKQSSHTPVMLPDGTPAERNATPDEMSGHPTPLPPTPGPPGSTPPSAPLPPGVPILEKDLVDEIFEAANAKAKKAERRILDWMIEDQYPATMRSVIRDSARLGVGVLKSPFPIMRKAMALTRQGEQVTLAFEEKLCPGSKAVSPWNLFPSPSCGEKVRNGEAIFERDCLSTKQVQDLAHLPGYHKRAIEQVLKEGPQKRHTENVDPNVSNEDTRYEAWYYYGQLSREEWQAIQDVANQYDNHDDAPTLKDGEHSVYAIVTLLNDAIVYAAINPLTSGHFPYHTFPWQHRAGSWGGVGVAEQIAMPARMVTAATRALLDNAGRSAGAQVVMDRDAVVPQNDSYDIERDKIWLKSPDCDDVRKAFTLFQIPNVGPQLMAIIEYGFKLAEDSCNIPLISQGQSGKTTPDTYGAAKLQDNNANQLLRSIACVYDDCITEPTARDHYEWLLLDDKVPADEKGDFQINAHGSSSLVERHIQDETVAQMGELVAKSSKVFGVDPIKWFAEYLKSKRLDPRKFQYTEQQLEQQAQQPPPKPPVVQVAELNAQVALKKIAKDTDRDKVYVDAEKEQNTLQHEERMQELALKRELELLRYANDQQLTLMEVKSQLAQKAMVLQTQKELSVLDTGLALHQHHTAPQVATPPDEPAGRAEPGHAFEQ